MLTGLIRKLQNVETDTVRSGKQSPVPWIVVCRTATGKLVAQMDAGDFAGNAPTEEPAPKTITAVAPRSV